jgi:hypothetical protein
MPYAVAAPSICYVYIFFLNLHGTAEHLKRYVQSELNYIDMNFGSILDESAWHDILYDILKLTDG